MVATLSVFIAAKIDYFNQYRYETYIKYYYDHRPQKGPKSRIKPFDDIKDKLKEDFVDQEFKILNTIQFDFDFDLPITHVKYTFADSFYKAKIHPLVEKREQNIIEATKKQYTHFIGTAEKYTLDSYLNAYCLYFPAPIISAACLLLAAQWVNEVGLVSNQVQYKNGREFLKEEFKIESFL